MTATPEAVPWEEMLTLAEAAPLAGISAHTLKQQAERGRLRARKLAGRWLTTRDWLAEYVKVHGRKAKMGNAGSRRIGAADA